MYPRAGRRTCGTEDVAFRLRADSAVRRVKSGEAEGLVPTCACVQALNGANPAPEYVGTCRRCGACPAAPAAAVVAAIACRAVRRAAHRGSGRRSRGGRARGAANPEHGPCSARGRCRLGARTTAATDVRRATRAVGFAAAVGAYVVRPGAEQREQGDEEREPVEPRRGRGVNHLM